MGYTGMEGRSRKTERGGDRYKGAGAEKIKRDRRRHNRQSIIKVSTSNHDRRIRHTERMNTENASDRERHRKETLTYGWL